MFPPSSPCCTTTITTPITFATTMMHHYDDDHNYDQSTITTTDTTTIVTPLFNSSLGSFESTVNGDYILAPSCPVAARPPRQSHARRLGSRAVGGAQNGKQGIGIPKNS